VRETVHRITFAVLDEWRELAEEVEPLPPPPPLLSYKSDADLCSATYESDAQFSPCPRFPLPLSPRKRGVRACAARRE